MRFKLEETKITIYGTSAELLLITNHLTNKFKKEIELV